MHWVVRYKNSTKELTPEDLKYTEIDRQKVKLFSVIKDGEKIFTTKKKNFIFRKRHFIDGTGAHKDTVYIFGNPDSVFFGYHLNSFFVLKDPDLEYTQDELLYI